MITSLKYYPILIASIVMMASFLFKILLVPDLKVTYFAREPNSIKTLSLDCTIAVDISPTLLTKDNNLSASLHSTPLVIRLFFKLVWQVTNSSFIFSSRFKAQFRK